MRRPSDAAGRRRRRWRLTLLSAAAVLGAVAAATSTPWRAARAELAAARAVVGRPLPALTAGAPSTWLDPRGRLETWLASDATPPAARRTVALAMADRGSWDWSSRPPELLHRWLRDVAAATMPADEEWRLAVDRLARCAHEDEPASDRTIAAWLAASPSSPRDRQVREVLFAGLAATGRLAGPAGAARFASAGPRSVRLRHLALETVADGLDAAIRDAGPDVPPDVAAALLVRVATVRPRWLPGDRAPELADLLAASPIDALAAALAVAGDHLGPAEPAAEIDARLAELAAAGSVHAARLRAARPWSAAFRPPPSPAAALAEGDPEAALRATIAGLRRPEPISPRLAERLLDDPAVPPALVALLVDRRAAADVRRRLAASWMRSLDDRRKQAGAILVALLPATVDATGTSLVADLAAAHAIEDRPDVRRVQRLALLAAGRPMTGGPTPAMLLATAPAARRPTLVMLVALSGDRSALAGLTELPPAADAGTVALLDAAIARLVPHWARDVGRTVGGGALGPRLHRDRLEARRLAEGPRLRFDAAARRFEPPVAAVIPPGDPAGLPGTGRGPMIEP